MNFKKWESTTIILLYYIVSFFAHTIIYIYYSNAITYTDSMRFYYTDILKTQLLDIAFLPISHYSKYSFSEYICIYNLGHVYIYSLG